MICWFEFLKFNIYFFIYLIYYLQKKKRINIIKLNFNLNNIFCITNIYCLISSFYYYYRFFNVTLIFFFFLIFRFFFYHSKCCRCFTTHTHNLFFVVNGHFESIIITLVSIYCIKDEKRINLMNYNNENNNRFIWFKFRLFCLPKIYK